MPFVKRVVQPKYICRKRQQQQNAPGDLKPGDALLPSTSSGNVLPLQDFELETITNVTLSNALRQLASLLLISNEIFSELNKELDQISDRSHGLKQRIKKLAQKVDNHDPKLVSVPESDLIAFVNVKNHYKRDQKIETSLFTPETRTDTLKEMYDAAAKTPVPVMDELDRILGENRRRSSDAFLCTPVLGQIRRRMKNRVDLEIEARMPAVIDDLRKWTSQEAIGDITVGPDAISRVISTSSANNTQSNISRDDTDDTLYSTFNSSAITSRSNTNESVNDATLDHRLPSPEEQQKIIALKYPAETIRVDVSGKRFDRMSAARKSMLHVQMRCTASPEDEAEDGLDSGGDTIKRRSRSRKPRGKRRNTIAGIDGKEIEEAANRQTSVTTNMVELDTDLVPRSKSSDILKKDEKILPRQSHFNTLKQWGRNRLRLITLRGSDNDKQPTPIDKQVPDIDDFNTQDTMRMNSAFRKRQMEKEKERKLLHERKPSYSSQSEKSVAAPVSTLSTIPVTMNPVKLRESSIIRRQRRHGLGQKEEPNSSSGNWSASSESGRTSIGSEITTTTHPKSSASSGSLNHHHAGSSGPPSSIISRRRFLNTSASSSITSEGTATPDLQTFGDFHDEDGTSSVYSCDTEGYYTSFHMDSGLKTLKEEEPATPLHNSQYLSSTTSFESSGNQTVISPENEYELFGRGSTSTTTSSAGTICTVVLPEKDQNSVPDVPERKSSLTKLNRSSSSVSNTYMGTLERSYSSSTVGSTLERMGTIKRNGVLLQKEVQTLVNQAKDESLKISRTESPDSGNNTSSSPIESNSNSSPTQSQQGVRSNSEFEYSESSDLECVDRIERIRIKTTINTSRIPSMCIITPGNSDDDEKMKNRKNSDSSEDREMAQVIEIAFGDDTPINENEIKRMAYKEKLVYDIPSTEPYFKKEVFKKTTLLPLGSFMGKIREVLNKKSPNKEVPMNGEEQYDEMSLEKCGEYVTIADVSNTNKLQKRNSGVYYSNDVVKRNLATVLSGNLNEETEYVSLNELPCNIRCESNLLSTGDYSDEKIDKNTTRENNSNSKNTTITEMEGNDKQQNEEQNRFKGARVTLDAHGKVLYSSDSLKRRKGAHTTFAPGPNVKDNTQKQESVTIETLQDKDIQESVTPTTVISPLLSGGVLNRKLNQIRPVVSQRLNSPIVETVTNVPSDITMRGAYVNIQEVQSNTNNTLMTQSHYDYSTSGNTMLPGINEEDYPLSSHEQNFNTSLMGRSSYISSTLPRFQNSPIYESPTAAYPTKAMPDPIMATGQFQHGNHIYWTLQSRGKPAFYGTDDLDIAQTEIPIEQFYSTPNKLRTTKHGFDNYFSPVLPSETIAVGKVHESKSRETNESNGSLKTSPIDPRNNGGINGFQTSTPAKTELSSPTRVALSEELKSRLRLTESGIRSTGNSPISSGRSTPRLEPQARSRHSWASNNAQVPETCADRMKTPKTSLIDFKRLLLEKQATNTATKKSAVEQLLMQKQQQFPGPAPCSPTTSGPNKGINSSMNILDLSGSPKTFATRRMLRQGNFGTSSPSKSVCVPKHVSPKTGWRYNNLRSDVISTAIPEANSEDDSSPNNSTQRHLNVTLSPTKFDQIMTITETKGDDEKVVKEKLSIRDNIFLKAEENNFMKHELLHKQTPSGLYTRAQLQAQRAQFLLGSNNCIKPSINLIAPKFSDDLPSASTTQSSASQQADSAPPTLETSL